MVLLFTIINSQHWEYIVQYHYFKPSIQWLPACAKTWVTGISSTQHTSSLRFYLYQLVQAKTRLTLPKMVTLVPVKLMANAINFSQTKLQPQIIYKT